MRFDPDDLDRRDRRLIGALLPVLERFNRAYLRLDARDVDALAPPPALLVANHNGGILGPDLACTMAILWRAAGDTPVYALAHDFAMRQLTPLGRVLQRLGAIRASPANARRGLARGAYVLVYPGGDLEAYRRTRDRDRVVFGARDGFVRVAQAAGVSIVPIVTQGAHRSAWIVRDGRSIARALRLGRWGRLERFPIALALPWGVALGPWLPYLPLPLRVRLRILPAIDPAGEPSAVRERVRAAMQDALDRMAAS